MKTSKLMLFLAFIFCISLSQTATAAVSQTNEVLTTTVAKDNQKLSAKTLKKSIKQQFKKVKKDVKNFLKDQKENASIGKYLLIALAGLACIGLAVILDFGLLYTVGSVLVIIAIVWWILDLLGVL